MERKPLRSARWFGANDLAGFIHRASLHAEGSRARALDGRPVIGICNSWSELVNCNLHFRGLAEAVKRGVLQAGGLPLEFPTISLGENLMKPTTMLFRNLMAMDVEECIRSYPLDAVVLLGGCDKTVPAQLMGAVSAGVPGDHGHRRACRRPLFPRSRARRRHRSVALRRRAARGPDVAGGVRRAGGRCDAFIRSLQRAGHRLDDDSAGRGARHVPAGHVDDSRRRRRAACALRRRPGARAVALAREGLRPRRSSRRSRSTTPSRC